MNKVNDKWVSPYWHPAVTSDAVIFGFDGSDLNILLIQRKNEPFKNCWAIPGGFLEQSDDNSEECAKRELKEETSADCLTLYEVGAFTDKNRDPRERVISIAYYALVNKMEYNVQAADDANKAEWIKVSDLEQIELAFDHEKIIEAALEKLRNRVLSEPLCFSLLDKEFSLSQLHGIYQAILDPNRQNDQLSDIENFKTKMLGLKNGTIENTGSAKSIFQLIRPAVIPSKNQEGEELYCFNRKEYNANGIIDMARMVI